MTGWVQLTKKVRSLITEGDQRSVKAKKNILASFLVKGFNIAVGFLLVPLTIDYIDKSLYGIWLTLSSIVTWFRFFDVGLGNGLKNKFAEALAKGDRHLARVYVSTTYGVLTLICGGMALLFFIVNPFLNWAEILEAPAHLAGELSAVAVIVFTSFCMNFVLNLLNTLVTADQRPSLVGMFQFIINLITLIAIFILTNFTQGSLLNLAWVLGGVPVLVMAVAGIYFFAKDYRDFIPSFKLMDFRYFRDLISLGAQFFVIQIIGIILFSTSNMIITKVLGPAEVTTYNVAYKYFGIVTQLFTIVSTPYWAAFTEAFHKEERSWIRDNMRKLIRVWQLAAVLAVVMLLISPWLVPLWVKGVTLPWPLAIMMALYTVLLTWGTPFVTFINGVGKVRLQLVVSLFGGILYIPLAILLTQYFGLGSGGVITATILCLSFGYVFAPIQYKKIIGQTANGIWNK